MKDPYHLMASIRNLQGYAREVEPQGGPVTRAVQRLIEEVAEYEEGVEE